MPEPFLLTPDLLVQLRIYDVLMVIARGVNKEEAEYVANEHEAGHLVALPPYFAPITESDDTDYTE